MQGWLKSRRGVWKSDGGSIAVAFAFALPVALMVIGCGIDYGQATFQRERLQKIADAAALSAARELGLSDARRSNVPAIVDTMVQRMVAGSGKNSVPVTTETTVSDQPLEVAVKAQQATRPYFGGAFGFAPMDITVVSVARVVGRPNICVLALDPIAGGAISLEKNAHITGQDCAVFSNSVHANGIKSKSSAVLTASLICSAGGRDGSKGNFMPEPLTDCPTFDDPLGGRPEPIIGACDATLPKTVTSTMTLPPGTYCGGLTLKSGAVVTLEPGVYVMRDGPLMVEDTATLTGVDVGFFLTGSGALMTFKRGSHIDLSAARTGDLAGLLVFEGRSQTTSSTHQVLSDDARNLLGTIYLSRGRLHVDANKPIADKSAYTAIVARMLTLYGGPHLVLNSNYGLTDVPVPDGIRGAGQSAALVK